MMDYSICSDQDLILGAHSGDRRAEEELLMRYRQKVRMPVDFICWAEMMRIFCKKE